MRPVADPRPGLRVQVEGARLEFELRVRPLDLDRRRQHPVLEREDHFEKRDAARRRFRVAHLRLHGPQRAPGVASAARSLEDLAERHDLCNVAGLGSGAVRLDQLNRGGWVAGRLVGPAQRTRLALREGCVDALGATVRRGADAADHGVDPVAVALRVRQPLERDHRHALSEHGSVRLLGEGAAILCRRERGRLAEAHEHEDVVQRIDAPRDHQVRGAGLQLVRGHGDRREGARACGVRDEVRAPEIEPVGDPARDDVAQEAGEARLLPGREVLGDPVADRVRLLHRKSVLQHGLTPDRTLQAAAHGNRELLDGSGTQDHAHPIPRQRFRSAARHVVQHLLGDEEAEQLGGVCGGKHCRGDAEFDGVELDLGDERAPRHVRPVRRSGIRVVVVAAQPVRGRDVPEEVAARDDVSPEAADILRARADRADADNRDQARLPLRLLPVVRVVDR